MTLNFTLNNKLVSVEVEPETRLVDILRYNLKFNGTKESCGEGQCGACSVLVNNKLVLSCLIPAIKLINTDVKTIEFFSQNGQLNYVQKAFVDAGAIQCGFCTPGLVIAVYS